MVKTLRVGQSCEVVKVLADGGYLNRFKINGFTVGFYSNFGIRCLSNHENQWLPPTDLFMMYHEVEKIGKLTITKLK